VVFLSTPRPQEGHPGEERPGITQHTALAPRSCKARTGEAPAGCRVSQSQNKVISQPSHPSSLCRPKPVAQVTHLHAHSAEPLKDLAHLRLVVVDPAEHLEVGGGGTVSRRQGGSTAGAFSSGLTRERAAVAQGPLQAAIGRVERNRDRLGGEAKDRAATIHL